ncbi:uncharacterized protein LOC142358144 [Convolutriloba macropyga]|uniref:uncharacterized protein LOC142358144 n=1 Tax=Convolutriloba macropyga TaxID=536237 RepID=UPI003F52486C
MSQCSTPHNLQGFLPLARSLGCRQGVQGLFYFMEVEKPQCKGPVLGTGRMSPHPCVGSDTCLRLHRNTHLGRSSLERGKACEPRCICTSRILSTPSTVAHPYSSARCKI